MSEQFTGAGRLTVEDALLVAHDHEVKWRIDNSSADRRVARKLLHGVENGYDAIPGIYVKSILARTALRQGEHGYPLSGGLVNRLRQIKARRSLKGENLDDLISEGSSLWPYQAGYIATSKTLNEVVADNIALAHTLISAAAQSDEAVDRRTSGLIDGMQLTEVDSLRLIEAQQRLGLGHESGTGNTTGGWPVYRYGSGVVTQSTGSLPENQNYNDQQQSVGA